MSQKYWFPASFPHHILALIISNTVMYGRVTILTGDGIVFQNGAVQTVIIHHQSVDGRLKIALHKIVVEMD